MSAGVLSDSAAGRRVVVGDERSGAPKISVRTRLAGNSRIATLDAGRLVAIVSIIFVHAVESPELKRVSTLGTFGVPFYLFASLYFQAQSFKRHPGRQVHQYIAERFRRLYLPFLVWSVIYLIARDAKHLLLTHDGFVRLNFSYLWSGVAYHLWFLPLLFIVTVVTAVLNRVSAEHSQAHWWIIIFSAIIGTFLSVTPKPPWLHYVQGEEGVFFHQCWKALPSAFLGLSLAWWLAWDWDETLFSPALGFAGVLLTLAMLANQIVHGNSRMDRTLSGLGWLLAAMAAWNGPWVDWMASLGRRSYGIYLAHVLVIEGVQAVAHHHGVKSSVEFDLFTIVVAFFGALAITIAISKSKYLRWMNGD